MDLTCINDTGQLTREYRYSADSHCPYVIVTDYLKSILLHFINLGVTLTSSNECIQDPAKPEPEAAVEKDGIPPRLLLTLPIIKRLEDAGLLTVRYEYIA